jgi:uncharacterized radical SAM superfamily protein
MHFDNYCAQIDALDTDEETKNAMRGGFSRRIELFGNDLLLYMEPFTPVSMTGTHCSLKCKHCDSYYLSHMLDGSNGRLHSFAHRLASNGANGILLSGGSSIDGSVPTYLHVNDIQKIKQDTNLLISAHTGIVKRGQAEILSKYLDMALVDVIGDNETIHDILGLSASVQDYENTLFHLSSFGIRIAPHIIVGLHKGELKGELRALDVLRKFHPDVIVIVIFIPTKGTPSDMAAPPKIEDVVKVITKAREMFDVPLSLSCVRPGGRYRSILDKYAILSGIDRMAVPSRSAYRTGQELGLNIIEVPKMCCSYRNGFKGARKLPASGVESVKE